MLIIFRGIKKAVARFWFILRFLYFIYLGRRDAALTVAAVIDNAEDYV
jgi:hypothetical protein